MNHIYENILDADLVEYQNMYRCDKETAKKIAMTESMLSALSQAQYLIEDQQFEQAVKIQNDLIMALIIETRKIS